jgi:hypothetical protein
MIIPEWAQQTKHNPPPLRTWVHDKNVAVAGGGTVKLV